MSSSYVQPGKPAKPLAVEGQPVPGRKTSLEIVLLLSGLTYPAAGLDMHTTHPAPIDRTCPLGYSHPFREYDPLANPFIHLSSPAYYAAGFATATGVQLRGVENVRVETLASRVVYSASLHCRKLLGNQHLSLI